MKSPLLSTARRQSAFTLIELLTVIAIIGILAAIIIPTVGSVREKARQTQCMSRLRQWGTAVNLYAAENRNVYRVTQADGFQPWCISGSQESPNPYARYFSITTPNLEVSEMVYCPTRLEARDIGGNTPDRVGFVMIWPTLGTAKVADPMRVPYNRASSPSRTLLMIERQYSATSDGLVAAATGPGASFSIDDEAKMRASYSKFERHGGLANTVFLDGSVRRMKWSSGDANTSLANGTSALASLNRQWLKLDQ